MSEAFKEMTIAYQETTRKIDMIEKYRQQDTQTIKILEKRNNELEEKIKQFDMKIVFMENMCNDLQIKGLGKENAPKYKDVQKSAALAPKAPSFNEANFQHLEQFTQRIGMLENDLKTEIRDIKDLTSRNESQLAVKIDELKRQYTSLPSSKVPTFGGEMLPYQKPSSDEVRQVEEKVLELERTLNVISVHHSELELQLQASLASTHNGAFLWRIPEVRRKIRDAKIGRITSIYSPPFYTRKNGYKMCIKAHLDGDGSGKGTHLSVFFVIMKGEYDPLLQWPFDARVNLSILNQDTIRHLVRAVEPDQFSSSFWRPKTNMNVGSGYSKFADLSILNDPSYVKEDTMYIKALVDISRIFHP